MCVCGGGREGGWLWWLLFPNSFNLPFAYAHHVVEFVTFRCCNGGFASLFTLLCKSLTTLLGQSNHFFFLCWLLVPQDATAHRSMSLVCCEANNFSSIIIVAQVWFPCLGIFLSLFPLDCYSLLSLLVF